MYTCCGKNVKNSKLANGRKLLWQNPNPTDIFAAQTITLNETLANYDFVEVLYRNDANGTVTMSTGQVLPTVPTYARLAASVNMVRQINFNNTSKVVINNGGYYDSFNSSDKINNRVLIPLAIYGIKY